MGSRYTTQSASGYNSSPPADDGSQTAANLISWSGIKTKVGDPLKNLGDSINTALVTAFDYSSRQITTSDSVADTDHMKVVEIAPTVTTAVTITLPDASTMTSNFRVWVRNSSAVDATIARATGGDTIDGTAASITLKAGKALNFTTNSAANGYLTIGESQKTIPASEFSGGATMVNGTIVHSRAGSAETIAIKTQSGGDPSPSDPVYVMFRSTTAANGDYTVITLIAATSLTLSSGSTLGFASSAARRLWIVGFNDAGTFRLGVMNCHYDDGTSIMVFPLVGWGIGSSTAEGGAGAADAAWVFYTGTAVTSKPYTVLGYSTWESGLATPGTWNTAPTRTQLFGPNVRLPGSIVQQPRARSGAVATGTTAMVFDDTIPQNTEGDQYLSQAITPTSAANLLEIEPNANMSSSAGANIAAAIFQDSTANALAARTGNCQAAGGYGNISFTHVMLAATTSSTTFKLRAGGSSGTLTLNGNSSARVFGGVMSSSLTVREIVS